MCPKTLRITLYSVIVLSGAILLFLYLPGNDYIRNTIKHGFPKIDQYDIFDNAVVKAGNPKVWDYEKGFSSVKIPDSLDKEFSKYGTTAYVVIRNGKIAMEQYWNGYSDSLWSNSFSMAKSVVSLLIGCAIDDGYIKSVEQAVSDFYPGNWIYSPQHAGEKADTLRIKDLLTMSAGFDWKESSSSLFATTTKLYYGADLASIINKAKFKERPGVNFEYQSGVTQLLAFVLKNATGKKLAEYASEKLWTPLGAEEDALWSTDKNGMEKAYCCFNTQASDFARIGELILRKGNYNGVQIVDSNYINEAISPATYLNYEGKPCSFYGYQFWIMNYKGYTIPYCRGILGQYIFIIPQLDMVIVRLGNKRADERNLEQDYTLDAELWINTALEILIK